MESDWLFVQGAAQKREIIITFLPGTVGVGDMLPPGL